MLGDLGVRVAFSIFGARRHLLFEISRRKKTQAETEQKLADGSKHLLRVAWLSGSSVSAWMDFSLAVG